MINKEMVLWLKNEFNVDFYDNIVFSSKRRVSFVIDINEKPLTTSENKGYHSLLNLGDKTMYLSKARGKGSYTIYQSSI